MNMAVATYRPQVLVDTNGLTEKEWLEWRRKGVGGSDASIILGISPFATARDLYYDKLNISGRKSISVIWTSKRTKQTRTKNLFPGHTVVFPPRRRKRRRRKSRSP